MSTALAVLVAGAFVLGFVGRVALDYRKYRLGEPSHWGEWKRILGKESGGS